MQPITIYNNQTIGAEINSADARELHAFLNSEQQYADWIKNRITQYGFIENQDYIVKTTYTGRRPRKEYFVTLDMAKELCMVENNDKGKEARRYFIKCEKELQAIKFETYVDKIADLEASQILQTKRHADQINGYKSQILQHNAVIASLKTELAIAKSSKPKTNDELEAELRRVKRDYEGLSKDWQGLTEDYLEERGKNKKLEAELKKLTEKTDKKEVRVGAELVKIQNALSAVHQAVGAVASYAAYDDEYFLLNLKG